MTDRLKTVYPPKTSFCGGYKEINLILSFIGYAIFKAYCISENRSKNIDILFYVKLELKKIDEDYKYKKDENTFFTKFYRYFVEK